VINALLDKLERTRPFTDQEAWTYFKIAAIGEAFGWSLLISGILFKYFVTPGNNTPVLIVGQLHGTLFLIYIVAVISLYSSLRWSRKRTIIAGLASIPPYGSLVFEQWAAYKRRGEALKTYREITARAIIVQGDKLLAIQPKDSGFWSLPGGRAGAGETVEQALVRLVAAQTGVTPSIDRLSYILQYRHKSTERLEMFFNVSNAAAYKESALKHRVKKSNLLDEISYVKPRGNPALKPEFLRTERIIDSAGMRDAPVVILS